MKPRQIPWKWLLLGLITLLIAGLALLPRLLTDSTQLASRVTDALSTWTGGDVKLTGPLRVHYFPDVAIKSGFELTNATRLPLVKSISAKDAKVSLDLVELMFGRIRIDALRLLKPEITLKEAPSLVMGPDQTLQARVANLLKGAPIGVLRLRDGIIYLPTATGMRSDQEDRCTLRRKLRHRSDVELRLVLTPRRNSRLCARLRRACRDGGRAPRSGQSHLHLETARSQGHGHGVVRQRTSARRRCASRHGRRAALSSDGPASPCRRGGVCRSCRQSGTAHWNGSTLTFDDGTFSLDGNASGRPARRHAGATSAHRWRRSISTGSRSIPISAERRAGGCRGASRACSSKRSLKYFDADLRISAAEITAPD